MLFYEERTARTASARSASIVARVLQGPGRHHQDSSSKGGEPLAPFVAWRKRAAKAAD